MDEVLPGLWVGGVRAAMDVDYLSRAGITHIITCMKQNIPEPPPLADGRSITRKEMKHVRIDDDEKAPILVHFAGCNELISSQLEEEWVADEETGSTATEEDSDSDDDDDDAVVEQLVQGRQKRNGRWGTWQTGGAGTVLVHCQAGCSRSVAIVAAYLMHTRRISASTAVSMIQRRREHVEPNRGFMAQLELYQQVGFEVDMKWQAVRRFLMSKTDILNGDSMDDMLLSYYPSPYPSPALSAATGMKGFTALRASNGEQAAKSDGAASTTMTAEKNFVDDVQKENSSNNVSSSTPSPPSQSTNDSSVPNLANSLSNMTTPSSADDASNSRSTLNAGSTEVKVTANSSGRLPGGVEHVRGHEGVLNRGLLAQPSFKGPKLRCKGCRRELAALDHVVIHEPGKGQMAFEHRRRDVGHAGQTIATNSANDGVVAAEGETTTKVEAAAVAAETADGEGANGQTPASTTATAGDGSASSSTPSTAPGSSTPTTASKPRIQSAASLASQLPPHLAALRAGRPAIPRPPSSSSSGPSTPAAPASTAASMLKHPACSSYFIEPMAWMTDLSGGEVTGRLNCPSAKCGQKLGSWDWAGMQCGCGAWVTPAFSLHRSKVDEV